MGEVETQGFFTTHALAYAEPNYCILGSQTTAS
jgi:hypothetical protein